MIALAIVNNFTKSSEESNLNIICLNALKALEVVQTSESKLRYLRLLVVWFLSKEVALRAKVIKNRLHLKSLKYWIANCITELFLSLHLVEIDREP